ncbi:MAG: ribosome-associated translation inhibitor RaiA [Dehalococcoidia bacterium]|nr:ribosome-associated translation inhibitor RaiA [Dehalococcoidia bacterium]
MEIIFRGQHLSVSDGFRRHATERLNKLTRYLPMADHAIVDLRREAKGEDGRYVVQVTVNANGTFLRAEERNFEELAAIDAAVNALSQQAKRFKERRVLRSERRVDKESRLPVEGEEAAAEASLPPGVAIIGGHVVRLKRFAMKPLTEAEAIEQMELLGHSFFLFKDADREELALLYRRRDGDYGMILPEGP